MKDFISATDFKNMILCADNALQRNQQAINELNVFPVPDGDTGTNMSLTVKNAATEIKKQDYYKIGDAAGCVASGLLRGARGNSGVITSLLFRGLSKKLKDLESADAAQYAEAMEKGVKSAYKAVMKPAEGTILTVSRLASEAATKYVKNGGTDVIELFEASIDAAKVALDDTVNQNPVLKKAGVVDAGGMGYITIYEAMLASLKGEIIPEAESSESFDENSVFEKFETEDITFAYDTVYIMRKNSDKSLDLLRAYLDSIGDSLVIGEDDECFKVHVHTNIPGDAITESQKYGILETAKIENMRTQHDQLVEASEAQSAEIQDDLGPAKAFGTVAVCAGDGLAELFKEIGADRIVTGGQTMNPSTDDILNEINKINAETIFVLPNNKNIIMAAEQCRRFTDKDVVVVPTKTVPQGISAMLCYEPENSKDDIINTMESTIENVHTAQITYAARDSEFDGHLIHSGEYLGLLDGALIGSFAELNKLLDVFYAAASKIAPEMITVYYGEDVSEDSAEKIGSQIEEHFPNTEVSVIYGGQPVYYYMISLE